MCQASRKQPIANAGAVGTFLLVLGEASISLLLHLD